AMTCLSSTPLDDPAGVQNVLRVESILDPPRQRGERSRLRLEHRHRAPQGRRALDQRRMTGALTVIAADRGADRRGAAIALFGDGEPQQPAAPIEVPDGIEDARQRGADRGAARRRDRDAPDRALAEPGQWRDLAD